MLSLDYGADIFQCENYLSVMADAQGAVTLLEIGEALVEMVPNSFQTTNPKMIVKGAIPVIKKAHLEGG